MDKKTRVGYRVSTYSTAHAISFFTDETTEKRAREIFDHRTSRGMSSKLERVTQTIEVIDHTPPNGQS